MALIIITCNPWKQKLLPPQRYIVPDTWQMHNNYILVEWMFRRMDGWMDGWMDNWNYRLTKCGWRSFLCITKGWNLTGLITQLAVPASSFTPRLKLIVPNSGPCIKSPTLFPFIHWLGLSAPLTSFLWWSYGLKGWLKKMFFFKSWKGWDS